MVGRAGNGCAALLLANYADARCRLRCHFGGKVAARRLGLSIPSQASNRSRAVGGHFPDSPLGCGDGTSEYVAESCSELAELRFTYAACRPASRQCLGCLGHERLSLVFSIHGRVGAVVWAGVRIRSWYVSYRRLAMRDPERAPFQRANWTPGSLRVLCTARNIALPGNISRHHLLLALTVEGMELPDAQIRDTIRELIKVV